MTRARAFVFTLNNPSSYANDHEVKPANWDKILDDVNKAWDRNMNLKIKFLMYGEEVAPTTGMPHMQGYVVFMNPRTLNGAIEAMNEFFFLVGGCNNHPHVEIARGDYNQNLEYCSKGGSLRRFGEAPAQGKRTNLADISQMLQDGSSIKDIAIEMPDLFIRYNRGILAMQALLFEKRTTQPTITWLWGATGVGKTRQVVERHRDSLYFKDQTKWWDGYTQQEAILIDDFNGQLPCKDLLRILDRYEYQGEIKGAHVQVNSPFIYITCDRPPSAFYEGIDLEQLVRRLDHVIHVKPVAGPSGVPRD